MSWSSLQANGTVQSQTTSRQEIESLRKVVNRDLQDAALNGLSADRSFVTSYNAALQLSTMVIRSSGYRISIGIGHHQKTFEAVKTALGTTEAVAFADYFETCRRKRNRADYDVADMVTQTEADE